MESTLQGWVNIDFHVHSPASKDFEVPKDFAAKPEINKQYLWLVEKCVSAGLDIIVITDHNTINGYRSLMECKDLLYKTKRGLDLMDQPIPRDQIHQIELFEKISILPGVEIDIHPCIHYLVIFDPSRLQEADEFLLKFGITQDLAGVERTLSNDIPSPKLFEEASKIGAIVIAAHADSHKGLWEESKNWGGQRIRAFTHESLYAIEFNNTKARDQIRALLTQPDYQREHKLSFVQSSDYHGKPTDLLGTKKTYIRLNVDFRNESLVFKELKAILRDPDESVSAPETPGVAAIIKNLDINQGVPDVKSTEDIQNFVQLVCAYANSETGTIIVGKGKASAIIGISSQDGEELESTIKEIIQSRLVPRVASEIKVYQVQNGKYFASVRIGKQDRVIAVDNCSVFILDAGKPRLLSVSEIIELSENNFIKQYSLFSITPKISEVVKNLGGLRDSIDILGIVRKIHKNTIRLQRIVEGVQQGEMIPIEKIKEITIDGNGSSDGDMVIVQGIEPRYKDSYLRVTPPLAYSNGLTISSKYSGPKLIIGPGGGVYISLEDNIQVVSVGSFPPLIIYLKKGLSEEDVFIVGAFLRSTILLWYIEKRFGSIDLYPPSVFMRLPMISNICETTRKSIVSQVRLLIGLEKDYLAKEIPYHKFDDLSEEQNEDLRIIRDEHNQNAAIIMATIDSLFYKHFELSPDDVDVVEEGVIALGLPVFYSKEDNLS